MTRAGPKWTKLEKAKVRVTREPIIAKDAPKP